MNNPSGDMSFLDHLEELRWHIIRSTISVLLVAILAFLAKDIIFDQIIFGPKKGDFISYQVFCSISQSIGGDAFCFEELPFRVQSRTVSGQFSAHLWTSILAGFILAFPYVVYEFWKFISPGLYKKEKEGARGFIFISSTLFFIGVLFGYYIVTPLSINFLGNYTISSEVFNDFDLNSYIGLLRASVLASGLIFELPIIIHYLTKVGLVTPDFLRRNRKFALVIVLSLSAIITPPDIASQIIEISTEVTGTNLLSAITNGTRDGIKMAVNVGAMLLVFLALIALVNGILFQLAEVFGLNLWIEQNTIYSSLSLELLLGYLFAPLMWLIGVAKEDITLMGQLLGVKLAASEFVAYIELASLKDITSAMYLSYQKSVIMATIMLCGFANFASIGIQIGGIGILAPGKSKLLTELGFKAMVAGTLVSLLSATFVGMLLG